MTMPDKQSIYVTLHDISEGGCCVIRTGNLPLKPTDQVRIEVWNDDIQLKVSLYPFRGRDVPPRECTPDRSTPSGQRSRAALAAELRYPVVKKALRHRG
ncbi:MAG: hypothetical protein NTV57_04220, partial [Cyanobacteria bacterium]|nr:hypothetical protein [Cyanobacteriota bacterium]